MLFEGDLKKISLASILQLIAQENLSGVLKIKRKNEIVNIGIQESQITGAFFERGESAERLENYLVKSGFLKKNLFDMIQEIHQETKRPIMDIIIEDKYLSLEEIERIIRFKIHEIMDEVFTWQEGTFKFEQGVIIYPKSTIKVRININSLILETARRVDEWPRIEKAIPSADLVFKRIERPELKLKPSEDEERVLSLLDGHRAVEELVSISGLGKFHTYSCLYHLLTTGRVELAYAKPSVKQLRTKTKLSLKFIIRPLTIAVILGILLFEFLAGTYLAKRSVLNLKIIDEENYIRDYQDYQRIFFYRHNRVPSISEVQEIFEK